MDPLTPPDCDLRDFAFMPLDASRLLDSDLFALASGEEFKAAIALWCKSWTQIPAASLPDDDRVLAHLSGAGVRWKKVRKMALHGFVKCSDGRLYHCVVSEKANEAWAKKLSYRDRSKKGNDKRWQSQKDSLSDPNAIPKGVPEGILEPPKGQGEGQREEEKKNNYDFAGRVIQLNSADLARWESAYPVIDVRAALQSRDDWLVDRPEAERARWFNSTSNWLAKRQQEAKVKAKTEAANVYPIA